MSAQNVAGMSPVDASDDPRSTNKDEAPGTGSWIDITVIEESDFAEWNRLFHAYIDALPDEQYEKTFKRLIEPTTDLHGLVLRDSQDKSKLIGLAHFFPHQSTWSEEKVMHLNDLFIDEDFRNKGYGRKMIFAVKEKAIEQGCYRLKWVTQYGNAARKLYDQIATCEFVQYRMDW